MPLFLNSNRKNDKVNVCFTGSEIWFRGVEKEGGFLRMNRFCLMAALVLCLGMLPAFAQEGPGVSVSEGRLVVAGSGYEAEISQGAQMGYSE